MAFFQEGMVEGNSAPMPLSLRIQIKLDQTFKMRYSMSLNYHWIQKYHLSNLKFRKKSLSLVVKGTFFLNFQLWRLAFFDPVGVQRHNVPQIKGLIKPDWNQKRLRLWQHYFKLPRPLEKTPFHREKGNHTKSFVLGCILYNCSIDSNLVRCILYEPRTCCKLNRNFMFKARPGHKNGDLKALEISGFDRFIFLEIYHGFDQEYFFYPCIFWKLDYV